MLVHRSEVRKFPPLQRSAARHVAERRTFGAACVPVDATLAVYASLIEMPMFNVTQSSAIVRVRGPLVRWDRSHARCLRSDSAAIADGSGGRLAPRLLLSIFTILSRRSVRRHNAVSARAFIAVHTDEVASLLP
jgi:hypothetical protein